MALKLNGTRQFLFYADDGNVLGGSIHTIKKKNFEVSVVASKKSGLVVNTEKSKYVAMYRDQNAGQSHNIKIHNKLFIVYILSLHTCPTLQYAVF